MPAGVRGIASAKRTARMRLCGATRSATHAISSSASTLARARRRPRPAPRRGARPGAGPPRIRRPPGAWPSSCLELGGRDLQRVDLDQLLEAVDDEDVAVGVDVAEVAGVQPAVGVDHLGRRVRAVQVAGHRLRPADAAARPPRRRRRRAARCSASAGPAEPGTVPSSRSGIVPPPVVSVRPQPWPTAACGNRAATRALERRRRAARRRRRSARRAAGRAGDRGAEQRHDRRRHDRRTVTRWRSSSAMKCARSKRGSGDEPRRRPRAPSRA